MLHAKWHTPNRKWRTRGYGNLAAQKVWQLSCTKGMATFRRILCKTSCAAAHPESEGAHDDEPTTASRNTKQNSKDILKVRSVFHNWQPTTSPNVQMDACLFATVVPKYSVQSGLSADSPRVGAPAIKWTSEDPQPKKC